MMPISILGSGMMTSVGLNSPSTCAAMRSSLSAFAETRFKNREGEWIIGSQVPLEEHLRGRPKLVELASHAIRECLAFASGVKPEKIPLLLCVAEKSRPGRWHDLENHILNDVQTNLNIRFHPESRCIAEGRVGGAVALDKARQLIYQLGISHCIVAGVDSFLSGPMISAYESRNRLLTSKNSNGFIPGEAGAAVLLAASNMKSPTELRCQSLAFGREPAPIDSEAPLRADGLVEAYRALQADGGVALDEADYCYSDCNGEQYGFKDDALAFSRVVRKLKPKFEHLHPADCVGEIGAAVLPCILGLSLTAAQKGYSPGKGVLCHVSNDEGERAALILQFGN